MAAVLDALVASVKKLITDMAKEEVSMLLGVSREITKQEDNMENIKAFLADAERRRITDQGVQRWVTKLKGAMYDAIDILGLCQLEAHKQRESKGGGSEDKVPGCFQPLLFCLRNPVFAHEIGRCIKGLNQRLDEIYKGAAKFNFITNLSCYQDRRMLTDAEHSSSLKTMSEFDETAIVGENIERDTKELAQVLITNNGKHDLKVVSIVGMGGMGKTTLAQKIFKEATIQEHFKTRIWLSITQHFDEPQLLRSAIKHAGGHHGEERDMTLLVRTLTDALSASRFLLVMDDVWSDDAWSHVLSVPIRNASKEQPGSRVLVTTRKEDLALKMGASLHQHRVRPLEEEDAWSLLTKQLRPGQVVGIDQLKNIGMEILKKCEGLPLAIKVIGGLLSTRYASERDWNVVLRSPAWSIAGLPQQLDNRIYLSYEDLSPQLKQCFLYCSLFPKAPDESSSHDEYSLEEMATESYRELIKRNLIEPIEYSLTGYRCTMHDVVRCFAEYMAREESVVVVHDRQAATCGGSGGLLVRRLSVGQTVSAVEWVGLQKQKALRTLIINSRINYQSGGSLESFSSLRVLYIWSADSDGLVASLPKLKHLRYLHLENTNVSRLPDDIQQMKFLQHIDLLRCKKLGHLPSSIIKLVHLRSLDITGSDVSVVPKGFGGLTNLRMLEGFPVHVDDTDHVGSSSSSRWCSLQELAPLSQLRKLTLDGLEKVPGSWMAEKAMISRKAHLSYLEFNYSTTGRHTTISSTTGGGEAAEQQQRQQSVIEEEVLEKLCPPTFCLENLTVEGGYAGRQLPNWMHAPALAADCKSLRFLRLGSLPCCIQLPDGLCYLPCLESLNVENAPAIKRIGPGFQAPSSLLPAGDTFSAASPPPFPRLRRLQLVGLCEEEQQGSAKAAIAIAMPFLETLKIENCKLSCLPPGLASINRHALREVFLYELSNLTCVENLSSVVKLDVFDCPELKRISGLPSVHKIRIVRCPKLEVLEAAPSLDSLVLGDATMETLPGYLQAVHPRFLQLACSKKMCQSLSSPGCSEWRKISHIGKRDIGFLEN
ncbi:unnamed protein product [Urochloa decumbens]|uniref:Uncharacterized protein n=1 Tax=Urochloa decumbens TaxID=240449 RepID=A0ABC9H6I5_9POAL